MPFEQFETTAQNVTVGAFKLSDSQIRRISGAVPLNVREDQPLPNIPHITRMDNGFYISKNGASSFVAPEIGDVKVTFSLVSPHDISICSVQTGNTFKPYTARTSEISFLNLPPQWIWEPPKLKPNTKTKPSSNMN